MRSFAVVTGEKDSLNKGAGVPLYWRVSADTWDHFRGGGEKRENGRIPRKWEHDARQERRATALGTVGRGSGRSSVQQGGPRVSLRAVLPARAPGSPRGPSGHPLHEERSARLFEE